MYIRIYLVFAAIWLSNRLPRIEGYENDTGDSIQSTRFQRSNLVNRRFRRDSGDDNLKSSVSNLQMIARITNAIYIQQGLISGTIPPDTLISELLHFGTIKPSDISTLDISKIQTAVNTLKKLPEKLKPTKEVTDAEKALEIFHSIIKDIKGTDNIKNWKRTDFEAEINNLAKDPFSAGIVSDVSKSAIKWDVMKNELITATKYASIRTYFDAVKTSLTTIKSASQNLDSSKPYWTFAKFISASDGLTPAVQVSQAVKALTNSVPQLTLPDKHANSYNTYFNSITSHTAPVKTVQSALDVFKKLLAALQMESWHPMDLKFTPGFPHGSSDLSKLDVDLKNTWMEKVINSKDFPIALEKLRQLEEPLEKIENILKSKEIFDYGSDFLKFVDDVNQMTLGSNKIKSGISIIQSCQPPNFKTAGPDQQTVYDLKAHLKNIDDMLAAMKANTPALVEYLKNPEIGKLCDDVIKICGKAEKASKVQTVVDEFKNYPNMQTLTNHIEKIKTLSGAVVNAQPIGNDSTKMTTIQAEAQSAQARFNDLGTYQQDVVVYYDYFGCLQKDSVYVLFDMMESVKTIRSKDSTHATSMDNGMEAIEKVAGTKDNLKKLEATMSAQKAFKSTETDALELLKDGSTHSKNIGLAVQGVSNMEGAFEKRTDLEGLLKVKDVILKYQKTLKDPEDATNLNSLLALLNQIQKMFTSLDTFKKTVKPSTSTTLADHSDIFQNAKPVSGASGDLKKIAGTIGKLKESVTDPGEKKSLEDVESTLKTMDSMGLDFSKFQKSFDGSKASLAAIDVFFVSFAKQIASVLNPVTTTVTVRSFTNPPRKVLKKEETSDSFWFVVLLTIGIVLVACLLSVLFYLFHYQRHIWNRICFWRKEKSYEYYLLKIVRHFKNGIDLYVEANRKSFTNDEYSNEYKGYGLYFGNVFQTDNMNTLVKEKLCEKKNAEESLCGEHLLKKSRVKLRGYGKRFKSDYYHASIFKLLDGQSLILAQTPLHGLTETLKKASTVEKFWWMVWQKKTTRIFMLNPLAYGSKDLVYAPYFPLEVDEELVFGDIKVKCIEKKEVKKTDKDYDQKFEDEKNMIIRELSVKIGDGPEFYVTHHWMKFWNTGTLPLAPFLIADLVRVILNDWMDKGPSIIHCGDGISETGIVAFIAYCVTMLTVTNEINFPKALKNLRASRADAVLTKWAYGFAAFALIEYFALTRPTKDSELKKKYEFMSDGYNDMMKPKEQAKTIKKSVMQAPAVPEVKKPEEPKKPPQSILDRIQEEKKTMQPHVVTCFEPQNPPSDLKTQKTLTTVEDTTEENTITEEGGAVARWQRELREQRPSREIRWVQNF